MCRKLRSDGYTMKGSRLKSYNVIPTYEPWKKRFKRNSEGFVPDRILKEIIADVDAMDISDERKYKVARDIMFEKAYA